MAMDQEQTGTPIPQEQPSFSDDMSAPTVLDEPAPQPEQSRPGKKKGFHPNLAARIFLRLGTILLCVCLTVSLLLTALVADVRRLTDGDTLRGVITSILNPNASDSKAALTGAVGVSAVDPEEIISQVNPQAIASDVGSMANTDALLDMIYEELTAQYSEEIEFSKEQLADLYNQSTLPEFLADKLASCAEDVIHGTDNTRVTEEEIIALLEDNAQLIEALLGIKVTDELKQKAVEFFNGLGFESLLREELVAQISKLTLGEDGMTVEKLMEKLRQLTSLSVLWMLIGIDLALAVLLWLTNWLRLGATLRSISIPMLIDGLGLSAPVLLLDLLISPDNTVVYPIVHALTAPIIPVHYGMLAGGVVLLIAGIVVSVVSRNKTK